jgi:hypothetical protein
LEDAVRALHALDPEKYNFNALARIFKKNCGQVWWTCHPDWRREFDRDWYHQDPNRKARCHKSAAVSAKKRRAANRAPNSGLQPMADL